jgi:predicted enzyme related to lactoylglutathione lyase
VNLNGIMLGTDEPARLVDYYTRVFGDPAGSEGGYTWWQVGTGGIAVGAHSKVSGKNVHPGRVIWNIESSDVRGDFERLKEAGAIVVRGPYGPEGVPDGVEMLVATLADPDDNYFQLVSPM